MATPTLSTRVSRRSMLAGGTAAFAMPAVALAPAAVAAEADAELFRRLAAAGHCWAEFLESREVSERLFEDTYHHPEFSHPLGISKTGKAEFDALAERTGYRAAADRCTRLHDRYLETARGAFDLPARGLPGIAAKMRFGVAVARDGMTCSFADNEFEWFDLALDDFERLSGLTVPARGTWTGVPGNGPCP